LRNLVIPIILSFTVIVAGIFAFMPINNATTVHDTIIGTQLALKIEKDSGTGITDGDRIVFDCDKDFTVREILFTTTNIDFVDDNDRESINFGRDDGPGGESDFSLVEIDGVPLAGEGGDFETDLLVLGVEFRDADSTTTWTGIQRDEDNEQIPYILFAKGEGTDDIVINLFDAGSNPLDGDEELTVKALFVTQSDATCSVSVDT